MKLVKIGLVATAVAAAVAFVGVGRPDFARGSAPSGRTVTVTGTGSVESVPNQAGLSVGVSSDAATAQAALAANADKAANVIEALRAAGVAKPDLQTTDVDRLAALGQPRPPGRLHRAQLGAGQGRERLARGRDHRRRRRGRGDRDVRAEL